MTFATGVSNWAWALFAATVSLTVWIDGVTAPVHAWLAGHANVAWLWAASFVHIDGRHLVINLMGLALVQIVFARLITWQAWCFALVVAAPVTHAVVIGTSRFVWVAGLSTALHAVVAWVAVRLFVDVSGRANDAREWRGRRTFGLVVGIGLTLKIALDGLQVTRWPDVQAQTAGSLHALAALVAGIGAMLDQKFGGSTRHAVGK